MESNIIQHHIKQVMDQIETKRNKLVHKIAKKYILDTYGPASWPQLLACIQRDVVPQTKETTYVFKEITENKQYHNLITKKVLLVSFKLAQNPIDQSGSCDFKLSYSDLHTIHCNG